MTTMAEAAARRNKIRDYLVEHDGWPRIKELATLFGVSYAVAFYHFRKVKRSCTLTYEGTKEYNSIMGLSHL